MEVGVLLEEKHACSQGGEWQLYAQLCVRLSFILFLALAASLVGAHVDTQASHLRSIHVETLTQNLEFCWPSCGYFRFQIFP